MNALFRYEAKRNARRFNGRQVQYGIGARCVCACGAHSQMQRGPVGDVPVPPTARRRAP